MSTGIKIELIWEGNQYVAYVDAEDAMRVRCLCGGTYVRALAKLGRDFPGAEITCTVHKKAEND